MYPKTLFRVHNLSKMCKKAAFQVQKMWKTEHDGGIMLHFRRKSNIRKAFILVSRQKVKYGFAGDIDVGSKKESHHLPDVKKMVGYVWHRPSRIIGGAGVIQRWKADARLLFYQCSLGQFAANGSDALLYAHHLFL